MSKQFLDAQPLARVVFDDQQTFSTRRRELPMRAMRGPRSVLDVGLVTNETRPRQAVLPISSRVTICTGMCRVQRILLQLAQHSPSEHVGQEDIQRDCRWTELTGQRQRIAAARRQQHLEAPLARRVDQHARVVGIVFDNQQRRVANVDVVPIVGHDLGWTLGRARGREGRVGCDREPSVARTPRDRGTHVALRQDAA